MRRRRLRQDDALRFRRQIGQNFQGGIHFGGEFWHLIVEIAKKVVVIAARDYGIFDLAWGRFFKQKLALQIQVLKARLVV